MVRPQALSYASLALLQRQAVCIIRSHRAMVFDPDEKSTCAGSASLGPAVQSPVSVSATQLWLPIRDWLNRRIRNVPYHVRLDDLTRAFSCEPCLQFQYYILSVAVIAVIAAAVCKLTLFREVRKGRAFLQRPRLGDGSVRVCGAADSVNWV
ncbi:hypothetical protein BD414DRAFT_477893 [Trametes punicea]|nr:hypothetical protein BD414DRAFT_477893 [Trametes punicea]